MTPVQTSCYNYAYPMQNSKKLQRESVPSSTFLLSSSTLSHSNREPIGVNKFKLVLRLQEEGEPGTHVRACVRAMEDVMVNTGQSLHFLTSHHECARLANMHCCPLMQNSSVISPNSSGYTTQVTQKQLTSN